jgi:osmoprotectant transport system permease protein
VVIGTKPFAESYVLGELFATLLEARGIAVERRPGLGSTEIVFQALRQGEVDVYPEYTGTGLVVILDREAEGGAGAVWRQVSRDFRERFDLHWVAPLGFENSYALAVRRATADSLDLTTLGDLARVAPGLVAGLSPDFIGRPDGLPGLRSAYDLRFAETRPLLQAVKYRALANGEVDLIDGYSTDGALDRWNLVVLEDDRDFFPPYAAAPLVTGDLFRERPDVIRTLSELAGRLDEATMRRLNRRVEVDGDAPARVAVEALAELGLVAGTSTATAAPDPADGDGLAAYLWARRHRTLALTARHLHLVGVSLLAALAVALPLGLALERRRSGAEAVIRAVGLLQTLPSIALLAFMIPLLGIGVVPAVAALFLYSLFPIVRNTYTGVRDADPTAVAAARALGMTEGQILLRVRLPLAAPVLLAGVRTAAVINVGTATLAAFIGAGGLGDPIVAGLALSDTPLILSGALPAAVLALVVDLALHRVEGWLTPEGLEG